MEAGRGDWAITKRKQLAIDRRSHLEAQLPASSLCSHLGRHKSGCPNNEAFFCGEVESRLQAAQAVLPSSEDSRPHGHARPIDVCPSYQFLVSASVDSSLRLVLASLIIGILRRSWNHSACHNVDIHQQE